MQVEQWPVERPIPYARNARKISDAAVDKVAASIKEFGWRQPIVVDIDDVIIAGHTRLLAAKKLGLKTVPVHVATELTPGQVKAYRLMDNRSHEEATWDAELLGPEMFDLKEMGLDLSLTGFDKDELAEFMVDKTDGLTDEDEVPETPAEPVTQSGDLWILGRHRLLCGDSTKAEDVARVLGDVKPHLMVTDPPYGVEYDPEWRLETGLNKPWQQRAEGKVQNDNRADWREVYLLFTGDVAYVWHGALHADIVAQSLVASGFSIRSQIIWAKTSLVIGRGHYHWQHEPCWYAVRTSGHWNGDRKQSTLWQIPNMHRTQGDVDDGKTVHGTQKPVECMRRPIANNSSPGQAIYEPFCGSGTTLIACEKEGRHGYALEIDPSYCDVIVTRWQNFTGKQAALEDGRTFEQLREERLAVAA